MTLGSLRNMYKSKLGKWDPLTIALCTLSSNISAPRQKIKKECTGCWDEMYVMFLCKTLLFMTLGYINKMYKYIWGYGMKCT